MNVVILDGDVSYPPTSGKRLRSLHLMLGLASRHHLTYIARGNGDSIANEKAREYLEGKGIDARIKKVFKMEDVSIGPFVLTGGELPAMLMIDVIARQVEGVLGNFDSLEESRVSTSEVYTRPEVFIHKGKKYKVPRVLLSGHQLKIEEWKKKRK